MCVVLVLYNIGCLFLLHCACGGKSCGLSRAETYYEMEAHFFGGPCDQSTSKYPTVLVKSLTYSCKPSLSVFFSRCQ